MLLVGNMTCNVLYPLIDPLGVLVLFHLTDPWDSEATGSDVMTSTGTPLSN